MVHHIVLGYQVASGLPVCVSDLDICRCCRISCWCHRCNSWCKLWKLSSVLIFNEPQLQLVQFRTNDFSGTNVTVPSGYCKYQQFFNCLRSWTIVKCCCVLSSPLYTAVAFSKYRFGLFEVTFISRYCWLAVGVTSVTVGVSCGSFCSVLIFTNHSYSWCSSDEWFRPNVTVPSGATV